MASAGMIKPSSSAEGWTNNQVKRNGESTKSEDHWNKLVV